MRVALALTLAACGAAAGQPQMSPAEQAAMAVDMQLAGAWRLSSYKPEQPLSLALLLGLQKDAISVSFQNGHMRNVGGALTFDRRYRIQTLGTDTFKLFIADEHGVEYESWARFGRADQIWFETKTDPWKGQGVLDRLANPGP